MIYTVECSYSDPATEAGWNEFYSAEKLPALLSVTGFNTSQRFQALSSDCPVYLAIHSVDHAAILQSEEYRQKGGGNFSRWQPHITDWHRNLYAGPERMPAIAPDERLVVSDRGPGPLMAMGLQPFMLEAVALDHLPPRRWLAKCPTPVAGSLGIRAPGIQLYQPLTRQLTPMDNRQPLTQRITP